MWRRIWRRILTCYIGHCSDPSRDRQIFWALSAPPLDISLYILIIIIKTYSELSEGGVDNAQISASHVTGQSSDLYREENSPPNYSPHPPPPTVSPPVVGGARSVVQGRRSDQRIGEGLGESSPGTHRVHRLCTHCTHCT